MDSANFWGLFGSLAAGLGLIPAAVAVAEVTPKWAVLLSNPWFKIAIAFWVVGVVALLRMAWLRTAHLHAEGHRCPDPEAHRERPRNPVAEPHTSTGPPSPALVSPLPAATPDEGVISSSLPLRAPSAPARTSAARISVGPGVTFETLFALYDGKMDVQAQAMADIYINKLMPITRPLQNVGAWSSSGGFSLVTVDLGEACIRQIKSVHLWVRDKYQFDCISVLPIGTLVTLRGRLDKISRQTIDLEDCELVE